MSSKGIILTELWITLGVSGEYLVASLGNQN